jgi:predicted O-linked N-acetylglucosamine transferase (SPINDLY family)
VRALAAEISARKPALILYLSVGMASTIIALASLRLAPIQCASYGHMATTMSPTIDYYILPKDFVGSPRALFGESRRVAQGGYAIHAATAR